MPLLPPRGVVVALLAVGCAPTAAAVRPAPPPPTVDAPADTHPPDATLESLRALVAAAPAGLRVVHELTAPDAAGAPRAGALAWVTTLPLPMALQIAAAGPVAVSVDGVLVFEATAPAAGALVPAEPLSVGRGELTVHVARGPAVVGFVRAILDENPPASAFEPR